MILCNTSESISNGDVATISLGRRGCPHLLWLDRISYTTLYFFWFHHWPLLPAALPPPPPVLLPSPPFLLPLAALPGDLLLRQKRRGKRRSTVLQVFLAIAHPRGRDRLRVCFYLQDTAHARANAQIILDQIRSDGIKFAHRDTWPFSSGR